MSQFFFRHHNKRDYYALRHPSLFMFTFIPSPFRSKLYPVILIPQSSNTDDAVFCPGFWYAKGYMDYAGLARSLVTVRSAVAYRAAAHSVHTMDSARVSDVRTTQRPVPFLEYGRFQSRVHQAIQRNMDALNCRGGESRPYRCVIFMLHVTAS